MRRGLYSPGGWLLRAAATALAIGALAGCAARKTPAATGGAEIPATWSYDRRATAVNDPWWQRFNGAHPGFETATEGTPLQASSLAQWWNRFGDENLTALVQRALESNADIRSARAAVRESRARRAQADAARWPTLDANLAAQRGRTDSRPAVNSFENSHDGAFDVDLAGVKRRAADAAAADLLASSAQLADVQVAVAAEVATVYLQLRGDQVRLAIAQRNLQTQRDTLQLALWRQQAGLAAATEVDQARAAAEQTAAQVPALQRSLTRALTSLARLSGQTPQTIWLAGAPTQPQPDEALTLALPAQTLRQRPDVRQAEHRVQAALARLAQSEAARYPSLSLSGSIGLRAATLSGLTGGGTVSSSLVAGLTAPLFDGGARRAQVELRDAQVEQARAGFDDAVLVALKEVEDALMSIASARARRASLTLAAEAAGRAADLARQRYVAGLVDFQTVLDTQRTRLDAEDALAGAQTDVGTAHVALYQALGGGWEPEPSAAPTGGS